MRSRLTLSESALQALRHGRPLPDRDLNALRTCAPQEPSEHWDAVRRAAIAPLERQGVDALGQDPVRLRAQTTLLTVLQASVPQGPWPWSGGSCWLSHALTQGATAGVCRLATVMGDCLYPLRPERPTESLKGLIRDWITWWYHSPTTASTVLQAVLAAGADPHEPWSRWDMPAQPVWTQWLDAVHDTPSAPNENDHHMHGNWAAWVQAGVAWAPVMPAVLPLQAPQFGLQPFASLQAWLAPSEHRQIRALKQLLAQQAFAQALEGELSAGQPRRPRL